MSVWNWSRFDRRQETFKLTYSMFFFFCAFYARLYSETRRDVKNRCWEWLIAVERIGCLYSCEADVERCTFGLRYTTIGLVCISLPGTKTKINLDRVWAIRSSISRPYHLISASPRTLVRRIVSFSPPPKSRRSAADKLIPSVDAATWFMGSAASDSRHNSIR